MANVVGLLLFFIFSEIPTNIVLKDQFGKCVYLKDTINRYDYVVVIYTKYNKARAGKKIRLKLESDLLSNDSSDVAEFKILEVAYLKMIPKFLRKILIKRMKPIKRQIFLDFDGLFKKFYHLKLDEVNIIIYKSHNFYTVLRTENYKDVEILLDRWSDKNGSIKNDSKTNNNK